MRSAPDTFSWKTDAARWLSLKEAEISRGEDGMHEPVGLGHGHRPDQAIAKALGTFVRQVRDDAETSGDDQAERGEREA